MVDSRPNRKKQTSRESLRSGIRAPQPFARQSGADGTPGVLAFLGANSVELLTVLTGFPVRSSVPGPEAGRLARQDAWASRIGGPDPAVMDYAPDRIRAAAAIS